MKSGRRVGLILAAGSVAVYGCGADLPVGPQAGAENVRVNRTTAFLQQEEPSIAVDHKGRLFVGWKEMNSPAEANRIAFARSLDGGFTWSDPLLMERLIPDRGQSDPWLAVGASGELVYAQQHACKVVVAVSADAGATWAAPTNVHDRSGCADKPSVVSDARDRLYLAYHNIEQSSVAIMMSFSQDGGRSWSPTTVVAQSAERSRLAPVVAALPDGHVYVAWWSLSQGDIEAAASSDFGATWGQPVRVNPVVGSVPNVPNAGSYPLFPPFPAAAVSATGNVFVAWPDHGTGDWDVLVARSDDKGRTWSSPVRIPDTASGEQWMVALAIDATDVLHAAWYDGRSGGTNVMYAGSSDLGRTWSSSLRVTTVETPSVQNRLGDYLGMTAGPDGAARLVWTDIRGADMDIYFASVRASTR